jgi:hypothetical protein
VPKEIVSSATVVWPSATGHSHALSADYSRTFKRTGGIQRTQKAIDAQHAATFDAAAVEAITNMARAWYLEGRNKR